MTQAWTRKEGKICGCDIMASCNDLTHTSSANPKMSPPLFVQSVGKTNLFLNTTNTVFVETGLSDIERIANNAVLKGQEKIGRVRFTPLFLAHKNKYASFATLKKTLMLFTQTGVFPMGLKNIVAVVKSVCWNQLKQSILWRIKQNLNVDQKTQKILFPAYLIMPRNENNILVLILTLFICLSCIKTKMVVAYYPVFK